MSLTGYVAKGTLQMWLNEGFGDGKTSLEYAGGPSVITRVLKRARENSLVVQWLGLHAFTAEGLGSIPNQEILQAMWHGKKRTLIKKNNNKISL